MHAEYIALSTGMRELVPIKHSFEYICKNLGIKQSTNDKVIKVWEDNEGALKFATSLIEKVTPHTKHFGIKYHWFRSQLDSLKIVIKYVNTELQKVDILTKCLPYKEFASKRGLIMNWKTT